MSSEVECDVLVIGSGAGGLATAISARMHGADVLLVEKAEIFGGTTAVSGGGLWVPLNDHSRKAGVEDSLDEARSYVREHSGNTFHSDLIDVYLREGPNALAYFEAKTSVKFEASHGADHHTEIAGGRAIGRSVLTRPYDARELGSMRDKIVKPHYEQTLWGMPVPLAKLRSFQSAGRSLSSALAVSGYLLRHAMDLAFYGGSVRLFNGAALAGRLLRSAMDAGVRLWASAPAVSIDILDGCVRGATVMRDGEKVKIIASKGVVLASGGFPHDVERRKHEFAKLRGPAPLASMSPATNTGDGINMAEAIGGSVAEGFADSVYWMPVSKVPRPNGGYGYFPHSGSDRGKPGFLAVNREGSRFVSEATVYHQFVRAMIENASDREGAEAFIICDHRAIRTYGLGFAKPSPLPIEQHVRSGYIVRDKTIAGLARQLGIDPSALQDTVARFNRSAEKGIDPDFNKGHNAFERAVGDPHHKPHPNIGPLLRGPFYGLRVIASDVGTFVGLKTDARGRVIGRTGEPIPSLYAVGADMANIFGGHSPGGGITLGPALTFGYLIGKHLGEGGAFPDER
jgi:succinate dehydrogenase/fumarate reductase flavoprotein subunit